MDFGKVKLSAVDYWGNKKEAVKQISDLNTTLDFSALVAEDEAGYYELFVYAEDGTELCKTTAAVITPHDFRQYTHEQSDFGIGTHLSQGLGTWRFDLIDEAEWMGAKIIRDDLEWFECERPGRGNYNLHVFNDFPAVLEARNMGFVHASGYTNEYYDGRSTPHTEDGQQGFANYVAAMARLFGSSYIAVDVYNEFWGMGSRGNGIANSEAEYYVPLQQKTYQAVKAAMANGDIGHDVDVLSTFVSNAGEFVGWYEKTLTHGGGVANYMDGIYIHPYYQHVAPESMITGNNYMNYIDRIHGDHNVTGKKIWATEHGANTTETTEQRQAQYVPRSYAMLKSRGVEKAIWYNLMDDGADPADGAGTFGFIRNGNNALGAYVPKPSYVAYSVMTRLLTNSEYIGGTNGARANNYVYHHKFRDENGDTVNMIWYHRNNTTQSTAITINTTSPIEITDLMGHTSIHTPSGGRVSLNATNDVIYVKGEITVSS